MSRSQNKSHGRDSYLCKLCCHCSV